jgi:hypothetical protein
MPGRMTDGGAQRSQHEGAQVVEPLRIIDRNDDRTFRRAYFKRVK